MPEKFRLEPGLSKYLQIGRWLTEMIEKGRYAVHDKLPSEARLAELFQVNRNTVLQAISDLVTKGLVQKKNGVGSIVMGQNRQPVKYTLERISSFTDDMTRMGLAPKTKLIHKSVIEAPTEIAESLLLGQEKTVIRIVRLRLGNRIPLVLERSYLPYGEYKDLLQTRLTGSLYQLLTEKFHVELHHSVQTLQAVALFQRDAELLGVASGSPGVLLKSTIYDFRNIPVEVLHALHRDDRYIFEVESGTYRRRLRSWSSGNTCEEEGEGKKEPKKRIRPLSSKTRVRQERWFKNSRV